MAQRRRHGDYDDVGQRRCSAEKPESDGRATVVLEKTKWVVLTAAAALLYLPCLVATVLYWAVGGLYAACATGAGAARTRARREP
jgi:hypothetical protein